MTRVFHFSGGRTSAYMVIMCWMPGDLVIFCDTGREHELTYKFIDEFEKREAIPVIRLQHEGGWQGMLNRRKKSLPNQHWRICTLELKIKTARRYLRSLNIDTYIQFVGFRHDEQTRVKTHKEYWKKVRTKFPLDYYRITKPDVLKFWENKGYNLETPPILGNCDLCFLKGKAAIMAIIQQEPERADKWIADEENRPGHTYIKGISMRELRDSALLLKKQYNLHEMEPQFSCACTS